MLALELLNQIFESKTVIDENGNSKALAASVDKSEGEFIRKLIEENKPARSVEVGCANGIASLYICSGLSKISNPHHTIIDPNQSTEWSNVGITNLKRAKIDFFTLMEKPSEIALPELYTKGEKFDFGFIDGWHTFDHTLMDFFYIDKMLNLNGIIVIDDISFPSINKVMRYILTNYPSYIQIDQVEADYSKNSNNAVKLLKAIVKLPIRIALLLVPMRFRHRLFSAKIIKSDKAFKLNSSMVALKKIQPDTRSWDWYKDF